MKHLVQSFKSHVGERGCHFYDSESCNFLSWKEVFQFVDSLPSSKGEDTFTEKLTITLANYNPDNEFLAVQQNGSSVSVELYCQAD
jgi:hypothetical protein